MSERRLQQSRSGWQACRLLLFSGVLLLVACPPETEEEAECPPESILTWDNTGGPFLLSHCTECHSEHLAGEDARKGAPAGIDFNTRERALALSDSIRFTALEPQRRIPSEGQLVMPPEIRIPQDEKDRMGEWLACGAP